MTYARKVDRNQAEIVEALRRAGYSVVSLAAHGRGVPDLLVGVENIADGNHTLLLEVKMPGEGLTDREAEWHAEWRGQLAIVTSAEEALDYAFMFKIVERTD